MDGCFTISSLGCTSSIVWIWIWNLTYIWNFQAFSRLDTASSSKRLVMASLHASCCHWFWNILDGRAKDNTCNLSIPTYHFYPRMNHYNNLRPLSVLGKLGHPKMWSVSAVSYAQWRLLVSFCPQRTALCCTATVPDLVEHYLGLQDTRSAQWYDFPHLIVAWSESMIDLALWNIRYLAVQLFHFPSSHCV